MTHSPPTLVRWIDPSELADAGKAYPDALTPQGFGRSGALALQHRIIDDREPCPCPCGRVVARLDQIRGYICCEWHSADDDDDNGLVIHGRTFVICRECSASTEQLVALAERSLCGGFAHDRFTVDAVKQPVEQ